MESIHYREHSPSTGFSSIHQHSPGSGYPSVVQWQINWSLRISLHFITSRCILFLSFYCVSFVFYCTSQLLFRRHFHPEKNFHRNFCFKLWSHWGSESDRVSRGTLLKTLLKTLRRYLEESENFLEKSENIGKSLEICEKSSKWVSSNKVSFQSLESSVKVIVLEIARMAFHTEIWINSNL